MRTVKNELQVAKIDEAYHRKRMEYYQETIKILTKAKATPKEHTKKKA